MKDCLRVKVDERNIDLDLVLEDAEQQTVLQRKISAQVIHELLCKIPVFVTGQKEVINSFLLINDMRHFNVFFLRFPLHILVY